MLFRSALRQIHIGGEAMPLDGPAQWLKAGLGHVRLPLLSIQACSALEKGQPIFDSLFVYENAPVESAVVSGAEQISAKSDSARTHTNYPMTVVVYPGDALGLHLSYDKRFFDEATVIG